MPSPFAAQFKTNGEKPERQKENRSPPPLYCITTTGSLRCSAKAEVLWRPRAVFVGAFIGAPEAAVFVPLRRWSLRRAFFATFSRCTFMKLCQHPSIQREAPEQELSGASFFRTCISLCASEAVFGAPARRLGRPCAVLVGTPICAPRVIVFCPLAPLVFREVRFLRPFRAAPTPGRFNCAAGWGKKV